MDSATTTKPLKVLLMHGTWARKATWPSTDGEISTRLKQKFGEQVDVEAVRWSGKNRNKDRQAAAAKLAKCIRSSPTQQHIVVAHSHAGNIVSYACKEADVNECIAGVVTMATPFIVARRRYGAISANVTFLMMLAIYAAFMINGLFPATMTLATKGLILVPTFIAFSAIGNFYATRWIHVAEDLLPQLLHWLPANSLIVRAIADETSRGIAISQFPSMATSLLIRTTTGITDAIGGVFEELLGNRVVLKLLVAMIVMLALFAPVLLFIERSYWSLTALIGFCALISFHFPLVIVLVTKRMPIMPEVFAIPASALVAPLIFLVAIFSAIFGPKFALANFYLDVSVEATPPGQYQVALIEDLPKLRGSAFQHSSIYENPAALDAIEQYIAEILQA